MVLTCALQFLLKVWWTKVKNMVFLKNYSKKTASSIKKMKLLVNIRTHLMFFPWNLLWSEECALQMKMIYVYRKLRLQRKEKKNLKGKILNCTKSWRKVPGLNKNKSSTTMACILNLMKLMKYMNRCWTMVLGWMFIRKVLMKYAKTK